MKKILSIIFVFALLLSLPLSAMAYLSPTDSSTLSSAQQAAIQQATDAFNAAAASGDTAGMAAAHDAAQAVRESAGYQASGDGSGATSYTGSYDTSSRNSSATTQTQYNGEASSVSHTAGDQQSISGISNADATTIASLMQLWNASQVAAAAGDPNAAAIGAAAHAAAEALRNADGYSAGADGNYYYPSDNKPGNSGGYSGTGTGYSGVTSYVISTAAGNGGTISPGTVSSNASATFTITPNNGYKISAVNVDGISVGAVSTYTFSNVTSNHTIVAVFVSAASLSAGDANLGDGGSGTLKPGNMTKSGYGVTVSLPVTSSCVSDTTVTASYNFTSPQTVLLESVGGTWQFPVNPSSPTGARKIYIPINAPGTASNPKNYTITFTVKALDPQATTLTGSSVYLTSTKAVTLTIDGSMYEDDFTGNS